MKRVLTFTLLPVLAGLVIATVVAFSTTSCSTLTERTDMISTEVVRGLATPVCARHDAFVAADASLDAAAKAADLAESQAVLSALAGAGEKVPSIALEPALPAVLGRHDAYVEALVLDAVDRADYLRSSALLRALLAQADQGR